jgi:hypothetical protein
LDIFFPAAWLLFHAIHLSALQVPQRRTVDGHGVAVVPHAAEQRIYHRLVAEKVVSLVINKVRRDDGGVAMIALLRQLEESVRLFGLEIEIAKLIDECSVEHLWTN